MPENTQIKEGIDVVADKQPANETDAVDSAVVNDVNAVRGINPDLLKEWKAKYGRVFAIYHLGIPFVYRSIGYHDYKKIRQEVLETLKNLPKDQQPVDDLFKDIAMRRYVLWPQNFSKLLDDPNERLPDGNPLPGGIPFILGEYIVASSGFVDIEPFVLE